MKTIRASLFGFLVLAALLFAVPLPAAANWDTVPDATFEALGLTRDATPEELYDALTKRYYEDLNEGKFAELWEPIPIDKYLAPSLYYEPPAELDFVVRREQCVLCHNGITHGWVNSWQKSVHANLDKIRNLPDSDVRAYKKEIIKQVERNLRSQGLLDVGEELQQVGCIDCHMGVGMEQGNHAKDLRLPDRAACGQCHIKQFAEAESEKDTLNWPQDQWPNGHPSHSVDYMANVELATWAALPQRTVAAGCTFCHNNQTKCDTCHTRHQFSTVEARKPEACATCHNGVDHNEYRQYLLSKHGTVYKALGDQWNWNARLADAMDKGGLTAPTCQFCHFSYKGEFTHNLVRKVRWGFLPFKSIAQNLDHPWFEKRKDAWVQTCSNCHSPRFAKTYLTMMDKGIKAGVKLVEETRAVVQALYDDGLLVGQKTNRQPLPEPADNGPGAFSSLFMVEGNSATMVDRVFTEMWEQDVATYMKGLMHVNPGGWTYTNSWSELIEAQIFINEQNTKLRQAAKLEQRVSDLEDKVLAGASAASYDNRSSDGVVAEVVAHPRYAGSGLAVLGGGLLLGGFVSLRRDRKRRRQ